MKENTFIPDSYLSVYALHSEKKTFIELKLLTAEIHLLTDTIRIERNKGYNKIKNADFLLLIRDNKNWRKCSLAGLRSTNAPDYYYSDLLIDNIKSLIVVRVIGAFKTVEIRVCKKFYPHNNPSFRTRVIAHIIEHWNDSSTTPENPHTTTLF